MIGVYKDKISDEKCNIEYGATFVQMNGDNIIYRIEILDEWHKRTCIVEISKNDYVALGFGTSFGEFCDRYLF